MVQSWWSQSKHVLHFVAVCTDKQIYSPHRSVGPCDSQEYSSPNKKTKMVWEPMTFLREVLDPFCPSLNSTFNGWRIRNRIPHKIFCSILWFFVFIPSLRSSGQPPYGTWKHSLSNICCSPLIQTTEETWCGTAVDRGEEYLQWGKTNLWQTSIRVGFLFVKSELLWGVFSNICTPWCETSVDVASVDVNNLSRGPTTAVANAMPENMAASLSLGIKPEKRCLETIPHQSRMTCSIVSILQVYNSRFVFNDAMKC